MTNVAPEEAGMGESHATHVAREFTRLYYHILNDNPEFLHQFYGPSSTVTVSETQDDGSNLTVRADTLELIKGLTLRMFAEVRVTLTNCTPQTSIGGSIQLMVSGVMQQKNCDEERLFTQALLLAKQDQGYYILNDTVHVHSRSSSWKVLNVRFEDEAKAVQHATPEATKGVTTPPQETEIKQGTPEGTAEVVETTPLVGHPLEDSTVEEPTVETAAVEAVPSPERISEDEAVAPPTMQNVAPIEKPLPVQTAPPVPVQSAAPGPFTKKSYRDALNAKTQTTTQAK